jgi:hypothetical protein
MSGWRAGVKVRGQRDREVRKEPNVILRGVIHRDAAQLKSQLVEHWRQQLGDT